MDEVGVVIEVKGAIAVVKVAGGGGCEGCSSSGSCKVAEGGRVTGAEDVLLFVPAEVRKGTHTGAARREPTSSPSSLDTRGTDHMLLRVDGMDRGKRDQFEAAGDLAGSLGTFRKELNPRPAAGAADPMRPKPARGPNEPIL